MSWQKTLRDIAMAPVDFAKGTFKYYWKDGFTGAKWFGAGGAVIGLAAAGALIATGAVAMAAGPIIGVLAVGAIGGGLISSIAGGILGSGVGSVRGGITQTMRSNNERHGTDRQEMIARSQSRVAAARAAAQGQIMAPVPINAAAAQEMALQAAGNMRGSIPMAAQAQVDPTKSDKSKIASIDEARARQAARSGGNELAG